MDDDEDDDDEEEEIGDMFNELLEFPFKF